MLERDVESKLTRGVRRLGGKSYKFVSPGNAGVPDRIVVLPGKCPMFVELKTEKGTLTDLQKRQIEKLKRLGQDVRVLYGEAQVKEFLEEMSR